MKTSLTNGVIRTANERCRVCYTCVRECPAKAIRIVEGQAEVVPERCIGCGNCVRVCSQGAKQVVDTIGAVKPLLSGGQKTAACLAPSFPSEFTEIEYRTLVGMVRQLGFTWVNEVAFGADLVARTYRDMMQTNGERRHIATSCPAIVSYVEKYEPDLVESLAPIVSPMVASARVLREMHGDDIKVVFIGPCVAKKGESTDENVPDDIDAVLTFAELRAMFAEADIRPGNVEPSDFDPPHAAAGALFPISRGLLQAAGIQEDLMTGEVVAADGRSSFVDAIREFGSGALEANLLEVLACQGCIMGAGCTSTAPLFRRRSSVSRFVQQRARTFDRAEWREAVKRFETLDLLRKYTRRDQRLNEPPEDELREIMKRMGKQTPADELNCGACGYESCRDHAIAIYKGLAESEMCLPYTIEQLRTTIQDLAVSNEQLASTQQALVQSEKLASMGQLAAGIAHEVNNPLGVVLMYAHLLKDQVEQQADGDGLRDDLGMIAEQADRCKKIVSGLLHFARQNKVIHQPTDLVELLDHGLKALPPPDNVKVVVEKEMRDPVAQLDRDQILQVLTNLVTNAYGAMPEGGTVTVEISDHADSVYLKVSDTGVGIPKENLDKIFEPFFTTKQIGKGTGLGLAVTYGIVKMHSGDIRVASNTDAAQGPTGTTFTVVLPRTN